MGIKKFAWIALGVGFLFFGTSYCAYSGIDGVEMPLHEALTLTFSFIGSVGTIASIIFALYFYNKQQDEQKKLIGSNQPIFMLTTSTLEKSNDSTGQPSYSFDISVKNFGHLASSFSLSNIGSTEGMDDEIMVEILNSFVSLFNRDDSYNFKVNISNIFKVQSYPDIENISFDLLLSYMDKFNSSKYEVYTLSINKSSKPKLIPLKGHHLLKLNE